MFRRIHLTALIADWRRTLLSVVGVAIGVTVALGVLILKAELSRPFDAFGPSLTHALEREAIEVTPNVSGRLPMETVERLRTEVGGAQAVIPVIAALTPVEIAGSEHGFFLLGGSCQIELLVGHFDCERRTREAKPADGPGVPLLMAAEIAARHGLRVGDELHIPGLPAGSAHLGWTFSEFDHVDDINSGYVLMAPSLEVAAALLSTPGYATAAFVVPKPGADVSGVDRVISGIGTAGPPRPHLPAILENTAEGCNLVALGGIIVGCLIAVNTILLAVEDRRAVMGTIGAVGAQPLGLLFGMVGEGAVVGAFGGLLGVPSGFLLGSFLVDDLGRSMLAGSGGTIAAHFTPRLIAVGAVTGIVCGIVAMAGPAANLIREGPLASMASIGGAQRTRGVPTWSLGLGVVLLVASVVASKIFEGGSLPLSVGVNTLTVALIGVVLVAVWAAPRAVARLADVLTVPHPAVGRLLGADVRRYALLFGLSAALIAESASLAIGSHSMRLLGSTQIAAQKAERLPTALLINGQSVLDQRDSFIAGATFALVTDAAGGRPVASRWRSTITSEVSTRLIVGVTPGDWYSQALYAPDIPDEFRKGLQANQIGLSRIAASRLRAAKGETVELQTVGGPKRYRVAGIFEPQMVNDAALGDIVLVSERLARSDWAAVRDQVAVDYASSEDATAHRHEFEDLGAGLWVYDNEKWRSTAGVAITRFLEPLALAGFVVMVAGGLSMVNVFVLGLVQRKRERAALRAIGMTLGQEQAVIVVNAGLLGLLAVGVAVLGGVGITYLWSLGSPVYYGTKIEWRVLWPPLQTAVFSILALVLTATVYPVIHTRRLETVEVLRST